MNPRSAQVLTAALAALLVVLVGATIFVILSRPSVGPTPSPEQTVPSFILPSPTATSVAIVSPSASVGASASVPAVVTPSPFIPTPSPSPTPLPSVGASPTPVPTPSPAPTPTPTPSPTPTPTLPPTPTPTPTPVPTIVPTAPQRTLQLFNVGVDDGNVQGSVPRFVQFNTDGPSAVTATVSNASGQVRVCLRKEPQLKGMCATTRNGAVQQFTTDSGSDTWTVSMIAHGITPTASLTVQFNANQPSATLNSFRFTGTASPAYNGFDTQVDVLANGSIGVQASFDDGSNGSYDYHLVIKPVGSDPVYDQTGGPTQSIDISQAVTTGSYRVTLSDPDEIANPGAAVFVTATISWP